MVANVALSVTDPNIGFDLSADDAKMKCYFLDTGLLVSHAFSENALVAVDIHKRILFDDIELNEGMLVENAAFVACRRDAFMIGSQCLETLFFG
jgi:hypothetical protein